MLAILGTSSNSGPRRQRDAEVKASWLIPLALVCHHRSMTNGNGKWFSERPTSLPDESGVELCERICELNGHAPVVFISGHAREADKLRGLKAGRLPTSLSLWTLIC